MKRGVGLLLVCLLGAACSSGGGTRATPTTAALGAISTTVAPQGKCPSGGEDHYTPAQLNALRPAVDEIVKGNVSSIGDAPDAIDVELLPGREAIAAKLEARFGNAVTLHVGTAAYHCGVGLSITCPRVPGTDTLPPGLHLTLKLPSSSMRATGSMNAKLVVQEDNAKPLGWDTGQPLVAMIVEPGTRKVLAAYNGGIGGTGLGLGIHDGQRASITTVVSPWRCDGKRGSTLSPGTYGVRAGISRNEGQPEFLAPEVPLTITR